VGATRKQILVQFQIESALLCAFGGVLGLLARVSGSSVLINRAGPAINHDDFDRIRAARRIGSSTAVGNGGRDLFRPLKAARLRIQLLR
jgi:hypothetical protein